MTTLPPFNRQAIVNAIKRTGIVSRPTLYHPQAVNPILALRQRGILAGPTTNHPTGPVTGGNKRKP